MILYCTFIEVSSIFPKEQNRALLQALSRIQKTFFLSVTEASQAIQYGAVGVLEVSSLGSAFWFQRYL
jgi:hypothetical protein